MTRSRKHSWTVLGALIGAGTTLALVVGLGVLAGSGVAASTVAPQNTQPPRIAGTAREGERLAGDEGNWDPKPDSFAFAWLRCDKDGGSCAEIGGATTQTYSLKSPDVGNTLRFRVRATNADGTTTATTVPTAVITAATQPTPTPAPAPATGCPAGTGTIQVADLKQPARLLVDQQQTQPATVSRGATQLIVRYRVTACGGRPVQGALVYATAVPFNQLSIPNEQPTGSDGWAELDFRMLRGFPISSNQQLIAIFTRARKSGENLLGGISSRRLFSVRVSG